MTKQERITNNNKVGGHNLRPKSSSRMKRALVSAIAFAGALLVEPHFPVEPLLNTSGYSPTKVFTVGRPALAQKKVDREEHVTNAKAAILILERNKRNGMIVSYSNPHVKKLLAAMHGLGIIKGSTPKEQMLALKNNSKFKGLFKGKNISFKISAFKANAATFRQLLTTTPTQRPPFHVGAKTKADELARRLSRVKSPVVASVPRRTIQEETKTPPRRLISNATLAIKIKDWTAETERIKSKISLQNKVQNSRFLGALALENDVRSLALVKKFPPYDANTKKSTIKFFTDRIKRTKSFLRKTNLTLSDAELLARTAIESVRDSATVTQTAAAKANVEDLRSRLSNTKTSEGGNIYDDVAKPSINSAYDVMTKYAKFDARKSVISLYSDITKVLDLKSGALEGFIRSKSVKILFKRKSSEVITNHRSARESYIRNNLMSRLLKKDKEKLLEIIGLAKTAMRSFSPELQTSPMLPDFRALGMNDPVKEFKGMLKKYEQIASSNSDLNYPNLFLAAQNLQAAVINLIELHEAKVTLSGSRGNELYRKLSPDNLSSRHIQNLRDAYTLALPLMRQLANPDVTMLKIPTVPFDVLSNTMREILPSAVADVENSYAKLINLYLEKKITRISTDDFNRALLYVFKYMRNKDTRSWYEKTSSKTGFEAAQMLRPSRISMGGGVAETPYYGISDTMSLDALNPNKGHISHFLEDHSSNWARLERMKRILGLKPLNITYSDILKGANNMFNGSGRVPGYSTVASRWSTSSKRVKFKTFFSSLDLRYGPVKLGNTGLKTALTKATNSSDIRNVVKLLAKSADQISDKNWNLVKRAYEGGHQPTIMAMDAMVASAKAVFQLETSYGNNLSKDLTNGKVAFAGPVRAFQLLDVADTLRQELPGIAKRWVPPVKTNEVDVRALLSDRLYDAGQEIKAIVTLQSRTGKSLKETLPGEQFEVAIFDRIDSDPFTKKRIWYALGNDKDRGVGTVAYLGDEQTRLVYNRTQKKSEKRTFGNVYVFLKKIKGKLTILEAENYRTKSVSDLEDEGITKLRLASYIVDIIGKNAKGESIKGPIILRSQIPKKWKYLEDTFFFKWNGDDLLKKKEPWMKNLDFSKKQVQFPIVPASPASKNRSRRHVTMYRSL